MRKYHYAIDQDDHLIHIDEVTSEDRDNNHYYCVGCGEEMSPVLGNIRDHHFRHKKVHCSRESYLHKLCKRKLKERFDSQKEFIIKYCVDFYCNKSEGCKLAPLYKDQECNRKELLEVDLKKLYDTCEEEVMYKGYRADLMLSNKEYPEQEPIFFEIFVSNDCEQGKLESGIQIIEMKIIEEDDVLRPLIEDCSFCKRPNPNNPYDPQSLPPIRFYNFKRYFKTTRPLDRFWLVKDDHGLLRGYCAQDNLNCRDVKSNHHEGSIYEIAIPSEVLINKRKPNIYEFGMIKAHKAGLDVRHCGLCNKYNHCQILLSRINEPNFDIVAHASECQFYTYNNRFFEYVLYDMRNLPFWEWKSDIS